MKIKIALLSIILFSSIAKAQVSDSGKPFIIGKTFEIYSSQLSENRTINIYLPEGYKSGDTTKYPVIYLLDGGADEDFIHIVGLVQFNSFPWINRLPRSIVVGIANVDRLRDFTYPTSIKEDKEQYPTSGGSAKFIAFLKNDLQPYIEKNFSVNNSKTIIGESLGGLLATEILLKGPTLFNKYIIVSPSLWWDNGSLLNYNSEIYNADFHNPLQVYIGVGKEGLTPGKTPHVQEVDANVLADKIENTKSKTIEVHFDYLPEETHATISHQAVFNAIKIFAPAQKE